MSAVGEAGFTGRVASCLVSGWFFTPDGSPAEGVRVVAVLDQWGRDPTGAAVVPASVEAVSGPSGRVDLRLWRNARCTKGAVFMLRASGRGIRPGCAEGVIVPDTDEALMHVIAPTLGCSSPPA